IRRATRPHRSQPPADPRVEPEDDGFGKRSRRETPPAAASVERGRESSRSEAVVAELAVEEFLRPPDGVLLEMLDDHLDVGVLLAETLEVEVVVERSESRGGQLDLADAAEGVALERVVVADVGVLLALVLPGALDVLGVGDPDLVRQRV